MSLFDKLFENQKKEGVEQGMEKPVDSQDVVQLMLANAAAFLDDKKPERAFAAYHQIVQMHPHPEALYNLGSLYAQGLGTEQNFLEAAYWFRQAARRGDQKAAKLQMKSTWDYVHEELGVRTDRQIFEKMVRLASYLYPGEDHRAIADNNLRAMAEQHLNKGEHETAVRLLCAAAKFGDDGPSQNYLGVLYNAGAGVEKNDLVSLYWFDRAADHGIEAAKTDRDGILNAYRNSLSACDFKEQMKILAGFCGAGTADIPRDERKAALWEQQAVKG